jgi:hypothetical protein
MKNRGSDSILQMHRQSRHAYLKETAYLDLDPLITTSRSPGFYHGDAGRAKLGAVCKDIQAQ